MLCFPEAIDVLRWKASRNWKKHLTEGEARELRIPTVMQKQTSMLNYKSQARENTKHVLVPNSLGSFQLLDVWSWFKCCEMNQVIRVAIIQLQVSTFTSLFLVCKTKSPFAGSLRERKKKKMSYSSFYFQLRELGILIERERKKKKTLSHSFFCYQFLEPGTPACGNLLIRSTKLLCNKKMWNS